MVFLNIAFLCLLVTIAFQDFKYRAIRFWTIPVLLIIVFTINTIGQPFSFFMSNTLINLAILLLNFAVVSIYFAIKNRSFKSIINCQIGIGDILFIAVLAFLFIPAELIVFLTFSFIIILFSYAILISLKKDTPCRRFIANPCHAVGIQNGV